MTTTSKSTQAEIVAEAAKITAEEREVCNYEKSLKLRQLKTETGLQFGCAVEKARYTLQIIDFSGKKVVVTDLNKPMPFYEFNEFLRNFKHTVEAK